MVRDHVGGCLEKSCEHCLGFEKGWSAAGAVHVRLKNIHDLLLTKSGKAFSLGDDKSAYVYRELAKELWEQVVEAGKQLNSYMEASAAVRRR